MNSISSPAAANSSISSASVPQWYVAALILSTIFWVLAWYGDTVYSLVDIWYRSDTFAHGFLIVPISAWLIWRRRREIGSIYPQPNLWMLLPLVFVGFIWLLSALASVVVIQQYCLVLMIPLLVATILGTRMVVELAFPFFFLLFAVPFGEVFLPQLIEHTADFTVFALRLSGIPVYREGNFFSLPSGNWSVVEACSGLRYLIASLTLGCLYAYLTYRSFKRRIIFVGLSIVVPIVANWVRAYMIVMIGHLSSNRLAVGVDHLIYGWLFFGLVMLLLFWIGSFWREDEPRPDVAQDVTQARSQHRLRWPLVLAATAVSATVITLPQVAISHYQSETKDTVTLKLPARYGDWRAGAGTLADWAPHYLGSHTRVRQVYLTEGGQVELYIGYYRNQRKDSLLITSLNMLVLRNDAVWGNVAETTSAIPIEDDKLKVIETTLRSHSRQLLVWHWYWVDGQFTVNPFWAKLLQAKAQLLGRGDDGAVIIVSTVVNGSAPQAAAQLKGFTSTAVPTLKRLLKHPTLDGRSMDSQH